MADLLGWLIPFYDEAKVGFLVFMGACFEKSFSDCTNQSLNALWTRQAFSKELI